MKNAQLNKYNVTKHTGYQGEKGERERMKEGKNSRMTVFHSTPLKRHVNIFGFLSFLSPLLSSILFTWWMKMNIVSHDRGEIKRDQEEKTLWREERSETIEVYRCRKRNTFTLLSVTTCRALFSPTKSTLGAAKYIFKMRYICLSVKWKTKLCNFVP